MRLSVFNLAIFKSLKAISSLCFPSPFPPSQPKEGHLKEVHALLAWLGGTWHMRGARKPEVGLIRAVAHLVYGKQLQIKSFNPAY